tara:strand:- start:14989 stop:16725 length:1737 start_codon:yes stop_codon:yes gene_type:complete
MRLSNGNFGHNWPLPITQWFDDELFYSLCCRFHYIAGNRLSGHTAKQLFGHARHGTQHDFPSNLDTFVQRTSGVFGDTPEHIILQHTILPFYLPWVSCSLGTELLDLLSRGQAARIKSLLGLPSSRLRANHPLRACPECMHEDKQRTGTAYWRLTHQLPGVRVCPTHKVLLWQFNEKTNAVRRFDWLLPRNDAFYPVGHTLTTHCQLWLDRLAQAAIEIFKLAPNIHIDLKTVQTAYRTALDEQAMLRGRHQIALGTVCQRYLAFTRSCRWQELGIMPPAQERSTTFMLSRLLTRQPCSTNPLHHLPLILWLFGDWPTFWAAYKHAQAPASVTPVHPRTSSDIPDTQAQRLTQLVVVQGLSVSAAAQQLGIAVQTCQSWAAACGIRLQKRPKSNLERIAAIVKDLRQGMEQKATAHKHGVSSSTISRLLLTEPGLHIRWEKARRALAQKRAQSRWLRAMTKHPNATAKQLREIEPASYAWLYRNDRAWLQSKLRKLAKHSVDRSTSVDWAKRDEKLHGQVQQLYQQLQRDGELFPITVQQIYKSTPDIKPALSSLNRLPQTRELLTQIRKRSYRTSKC